MQGEQIDSLGKKDAMIGRIVDWPICKLLYSPPNLRLDRDTLGISLDEGKYSN